jgi:integrase
MLNKGTSSLFDDASSWSSAPLEALAAWLLSPTFVVTKQGVEQPLRASSAEVYRFMGSKFIRAVILGHPENECDLESPGKAWSEVSADDIQAFLVGHDLKRGIRNRYVRLLERLYDHLAANGLVSHNPARGLAMKSPSKSNANHENTMWLNETEQAAVVRTLPDGEGWKAQRNRALIATVLGGGLKVSEVIEMRLPAIGPRQPDGSLYIEVQEVGAGRRHRTKVAPWAAGILTKWISVRAEFGLLGDLLFPAKPIGGLLHKATLYRQCAAALTEAGVNPAIIKRRGARTLRNTYAMRELSEGQPIELVGEYLGLRTDRSVEYYEDQLKRKIKRKRSINHASPSASKLV